jgi:tyrosine-protein kinase Etk/Wzc
MSTHKIAFPQRFDGSSQKGVRGVAIDRMLLLQILKVLLICSIISFASAAVFRFFSEPVYQITSVFSIGPSGDSQRSALTIAQPANADDVQENMNNEVDFLTSRSNLLSVVQQFNLSVNYRKAGVFHDKDLYLESPVDFQRLRMGAKASGDLKLTIKNRNTYILQAHKGKAQEYAFNTTYTDDFGSWQISKMPNIARYFGSTIHIDILDPELAADKLQANLDVGQSGKPPTLLKLSISDPVITRANDVLNALLVTYLQNSETEKERLAQSQLRFIDARLITLNQDLSSLSRQLQEGSTASSKSILQAPLVGKYLVQVKKNDKLLNTLNLKIDALMQLKQQFQSQRSGAVDTVNSAVADPLLNAMARTLYENESRHQRLLQTQLPDDPEVTGSLQQLARQKKSLIKQVSMRLTPMLIQRKKLLQENAGFAQGISALTAQDIAQINLQRQMQVIPDLYADLLRSKENAALNHAAYLAFAKPMNSNMTVTENKHFSFIVLLIGFALPLTFFLLSALLSTGKNLQSNP